MSEDDQKPPLDAALRHLAEQKRRSLTSHPTPQELAAYHAGELPPEAEAQILEHLAICRECSDLLLDLSGFADLKPPQGVPELTDEQIELDWQRLRERMREGEGRKETKERTAEVVPIRPARPVPTPERDRRRWKPIAASLLLGGALGILFGIYFEMPTGSSKMQMGSMIDPGLAERGEGDPSFSVREIGAIRFIPDVDVDASYSSYEAEIDRDGEVVKRIRVETIDEDPVLLISEGWLHPGEYQARLYGIRGGEKTELSEVPFNINE